MEYSTRRHHRARLVREALRSALVEGAWADSLLPSDDEIGRQFGVGRNVVREALQLLVDEGFLLRQQGSGTRPRTHVLLHDAAALRSLYEGTEADLPSKIRHQVLRWGPMSASPIHAANLEVDVGTPVVHYERLTWFESVPVIFWSTIMRDDVGLRPPAEPGEFTPDGFYRYVEYAGLELGEGTLRTSAVRADRGIAEVLDVEIGSPMLLQYRRILLSDGRPLEVSSGYFRSDHVAFTQRVSR